MEESVVLEPPAEGVAVLRLTRPGAHNAMTMAGVRELRAALARVGEDDACRVLVLAGEGRSFCAGLDLKASLRGEDAPDGALPWMALQELYAGTVLQMRRLPQPVVAAVQGAAVGFGFGLALAADVRLVAATTGFAVGAVKIGLSAGECGISYHLPRLIGAGRAFDIMLSGRRVAGEEAMAIGLASCLVGEAELLASAKALAAEIAANSPYAVKHTKQLMWANLTAPSLEAAVELENHVQTLGLMTDDFREGATAFGEKRPPRFVGR